LGAAPLSYPALGQASQNPQIVSQHRPTYGQLAAGKSFAAQRAAKEIILYNANASFALGSSAL